jgi:vancomycin resistance protein YoaR
MRKKRVKRKRKVVITTAVATAVVVLLSTYIYTIQRVYKSAIYPGVYVEGIDLGKKNLKEAENLLKKKYQQPVIDRKVLIHAGNKDYTLDYKNLDINYNIQEALEEAYSYGKNGSIFQRYKNIISPSTKKLKLPVVYNEKFIDGFLSSIEREVNKEPVNAGVAVSKGIIKLTSEADGARLNKEALRQAVVEQLDTGTLTGNLEIEAPVEVIKPRVSKEKIASINARISSFSTSFAGSIANRVNNIQLAVKSINGLILMPGEVFSFNQTVGERTVERGYKEAGVIVGDKLESGLGGGICQVSSTLYNAVLRTGLRSTERRNHTLPLGYVGKGLDATVDWGTIDYKFKNTFSYPIYIEGYAQNGSVYFNIYSNKELTKKTYELTSEVYETMQPTMKNTEDPNKPSGMIEIINPGTSGFKVKVYRKTYENNKLMNTELISNDTYQPLNGETVKGTKKR